MGPEIIRQKPVFEKIQDSSFIEFRFEVHNLFTDTKLFYPRFTSVIPLIKTGVVENPVNFYPIGFIYAAGISRSGADRKSGS